MAIIEREREMGFNNGANVGSMGAKQRPRMAAKVSTSFFFFFLFSFYI